MSVTTSRVTVTMASCAPVLSMESVCVDSVSATASGMSPDTPHVSSTKHNRLGHIINLLYLSLQVSVEPAMRPASLPMASISTSCVLAMESVSAESASVRRRRRVSTVGDTARTAPPVQVNTVF